MSSAVDAARTDRRELAIGGAVVLAAGVCWLVSIRRMKGLDMGPGGDLGPLAVFAATWAAMMAAMMLPSAVPAVLSVADGPGRARARLAAPVLFVCSYVGVWTGVGLGAFFAYRALRDTHPALLGWDRGGRYVAGAVVVAAGLYELTPLKRACLARCRARAHRVPGGPLESGLTYAGGCVGCSAGLMVVLFTVGVMSLFWMVALTVLVFAEKVPAAGARLVAPIAFLLIALGAWIAFWPSSVPGLTIPM